MKFWQLKLWRLNFILALVIIFCSPQGPHVSSLEAASLRSCAASLALSAACLFGSACAPVHKVSDHRAARSQALSEVTADLLAHYKRREYHWILHIDFNPNDFGQLKKITKTEIAHRQTSLYRELESTGAPWRALEAGQSIEIPKEIAPVTYYRGFSSRHFLGSFEFRHDSVNQAVESLEHLFDRLGETLDKTFLIVSGGSHGASAVNSFAKQLREKWGKQIEVVVVSDAISQPGPFPPFRLSHVNENGININFFQRGDFLAGAPIWNFRNYKVESLGHADAAELAEIFARQLLRRIEPSQRLPLVQSSPIQFSRPPHHPDFYAAGPLHPMVYIGTAAGSLGLVGIFVLVLKRREL
jgi:hypothetical protein